jgi:hypothetical protein
LDIPDRQSSVSIGEATYVFRALNSENQYAKITFTLPQAAAHNFRDFDTIPYALALDRCIADYNDDGSITITYIAEGPSAGNDVLGAAMVQGITTVTDAQLAGKRVEIELDRSLSAALVNTDDEPALLMPIYETRSRP